MDEKFIYLIVVGSLYIISIIVSAIISRIKVKNANKEVTKSNSIFDFVTSDVIDKIICIESIFPNGNGIFKLDDILGFIENYCLKNNIVFDKEKFACVVNKFVELLNNKKEIKNDR